MRSLPHLSWPFRRIMLPLAAGLLALMPLLYKPAKAADAIFVLSDNDGYGILDCVAEGVACGRIVADSWCAAHGRGRATAYGLASDITASIGAATAVKPRPGDVIISCGE